MQLINRSGRTAPPIAPSAVRSLAILVFAFVPCAARGQAKNEGKAVAAEVIAPAQRTVVRELRLPATLEADELVDLFAKTSGYVSEVHVDIGSRVRAGEVLVLIDVPEMADEARRIEAVLRAKQAKVRALKAKAVQAERMVETARAQVKQHEAKHELDQLNLARKQELRDGNAIPQQALDEAISAHAITEAQLAIAQAQVAGVAAEKQAVEADVEVAGAEVLVARAELARLHTLMGYASIKAPFDGIITKRGVDHGAFVRSAAEGTASPMLQIAKTDRIRIVLQVPEADAVYVRAGTEVTIDVSASRLPPETATISRVAGALNPETRTLQVEADIDNADGRFAVGMYARVVIKLESKQHATVIPSKAIRVVDKETVVFVFANGVVQSRPITIGYDDGISAEILSGLGEDDLVITSTGGAVAPGVKVTAIVSGS